MTTKQHYKKTPIIIAGLFLLGLQPQAYANDGVAELAASLLAKTQAADAKCKFLSKAEHDEISIFVARAEVALASRESISATKLALSRGAAAGRQVQCDAAERADISNVLSAARAAVSPAPARAAPAKPLSPKVIVQAAAKVEPAATKPKKTMVMSETISVKKQSGLKAYASLTERYYLARRCGNMSQRQIANFYQSVVNTHHQVLSSFGRGAVANVMHQSESKASGKSCT
jgi:hypothetical protein